MEGISVSVCIFAYNEEKHIATTISAILAGTGEDDFPLYVYANGCSDRTVDICRKLAESNHRIHIRELAVASKPSAWDTAFSEQSAEFIVFADGDILPDPGAVGQLVKALKGNPRAVIATCTQVPLARGLKLGQRVVGFLQLPFAQDFLAGGFYVAKRQALVDLLVGKGYSSIPLGVTGEDCFLGFLVGADRLLVSECRCAYEPPDISDYCRYLARIQWQNEQLALFAQGSYARSARGISRILEKYKRCQHKGRLLAMLIPVILRYVFKVLAAPAIRRSYRELGPVREDGAVILQHSRSNSSK